MGRYDKLGLQASSSDRWTVCTASPHEIVRRAAELNALPEEQKQYTIDGDEAHKLSELLLTKQPDPEGKFVEIYGHEPDDEQRAAARDYAKFVNSLMDGDSALFVEISAPLPYMPERVCRLDSLVVSNKAIDVTDLKYGVGVSVEAEDNTQLIINGMAALRWLEEKDLFTFTDKTLIRLKIFQPRARDKRVVRQWNINVATLKEKYAKIADTAQAILEGPDNTVFSPDEDTCRFCPLNQPDRGITCAHRTGAMFENLPETLKVAAPVLNLPDPASISVETLGQLVLAAPDLKGFFEDCRKRAYGLIEGGTTVPGLKLVAGSAHRKWKDEDRVKELLAQKLKVDQYAPRELVSPAVAEKLLKGVEVGTKFKNLLNAQIEKPEGKPTLVPESDERPALEFNISAASEFAAIDNAPAVSGDSVLD